MQYPIMEKLSNKIQQHVLVKAVWKTTNET